MNQNFIKTIFFKLQVQSDNKIIFKLKSDTHLKVYNKNVHKSSKFDV